jgi:hypothetical protein
VIAIVVGESIALGVFQPRNYGEIAWLSSFACVWAGIHAWQTLIEFVHLLPKREFSLD